MGYGRWNYEANRAAVAERFRNMRPVSETTVGPTTVERYDARPDVVAEARALALPSGNPAADKASEKMRAVLAALPPVAEMKFGDLYKIVDAADDVATAYRMVADFDGADAAQAVARSASIAAKNL